MVDVGPGLYTGIRVGLSTAQGLAAALGVPLVPLSSLDVIALRAATHRRHIWSVVDVRRGELAVASYRAVPGGVVKDGPPQLVAVERFRAMLQSDPDDCLVVGDWARYRRGSFGGSTGSRAAGLSFRPPRQCWNWPWGASSEKSSLTQTRCDPATCVSQMSRSAGRTTGRRAHGRNRHRRDGYSADDSG